VRRGQITRVGGAEDGANGGAADPVGGAFVADGESPTTGAGGVAMTVAAVGDRSGAGDDDDARAGAEGGFERGLNVADYVDGRGENFGEGAADDCSYFGASGAGASNTGVGDLRGRDAGSGAGLAYGLLQGLASLGFADADDVAGAGGGSGQKLRFVTHHACSLGSTAVDAEVIGHGYF